MAKVGRITVDSQGTINAPADWLADIGDAGLDRLLNGESMRLALELAAPGQPVELTIAVMLHTSESGWRSTRAYLAAHC